MFASYALLFLVLQILNFDCFDSPCVGILVIFALVLFFVVFFLGFLSSLIALEEP